MSDFESTAKWKVDVTQFTAAMQEAKSALKSTNDEFKLTSSTMDKWSNNTSGLEAKLKQLGGQIEAETRILDVYKQAWEEAKKQFGETSPEAERLAQKVQDQQVKINKAEVQVGKYTEKLNKLQSEQKESETAMGQLNDTIDEQQKHLDSLKDEYANAVLMYGKNSKEAKELANEIKSLSGELKDNKKTMNDADKAADELDQSMDDLDGSARSAGDGFTVFKGALANLVSQGISKVVQGVKDLARETFEAGSNFEAGMSKVQAISGASAEDMQKLTDKAKEMGSITKFSATESASAFEYMAMAGWKTEDMVNGIAGIMNLAAASGADLATTSDIVTDALTAMGYSAGDAGRLADVMAAASSNANTNVEMMGATFQYAAPIVGALGYNMEDTAVAIGLMANAGIKGEKAGTALRSILTRLSAPPKEAATAMEALGISLTDSQGNMKDMSEVIDDLRKAFSELEETEQTQYAKQLAGQEAMSGLLAIVRAAPEDYDKLTKAVETSTGAAERMANTMNDNVSGQITLLKSKIEGIMIKVFEKASGSIKKAINTISDALDKVDWDKFAKNAGDTANKIAEFFAFVVQNGDKIATILKSIAVAFVTYNTVTTVGNVMNAFSNLFTAIKSGTSIMQAFNLTMAANPYALIAGAVAGLVVVLGKYWEKQQEALEAEHSLSDAQQESIDKANELAESYRNLDDQRNQQLIGIQSEFGYLGELKQEYNGLIDSNGKVKEGYEDRANFILTRLAEALGLEIDQVKELVDENGKLSESIDEVLRKKQAEATLAANEQMYNEAITKRADALDTLTEAQKTLDEAEQEYNKTKADGELVWNNYQELLKTAPGYADKYLMANYKIVEANNIAKEAYEEALEGVQNAEEAWVGYNTTIQNYEGLSAAIISGDADKINESLTNMQYNFITAETGTKESLERQVQNYETNLENLQNAIKNGTPGVTQEMVDQAQSMVNAAKQELDKLPPEASAKGEQSGNNFAKGVGSKEGESREAGQAIGSAATGGAESGSSEMQSTGANAAGQYASGIESGNSLGRQKGSGLAQEALSGMNSVNTTTSGENFAQGFINGIGNMLSSAWNKAKELAVNAWNGLKAGQQEGSPSKLTRKSGEFFGEGFALGIESMYKPVANAAADMANGAVDSMLDTLEINSPSKVTKDQVGVNFAKGVIAGVKSEEKNVKKSADELASAYVSAARSKVNMLKEGNLITLSQEQDFWKEIAKSCKKGSTAYNSAMQEYYKAVNTYNKELEKQREEEKKANEKAAKERKQQAEERAKAIKQMIADAEKLSSAYKKNVQSINDTLNKDIATLQQNYQNAVSNRAKELFNSTSLFDMVDRGEKRSKAKLKENLQNQVNALKEYDSVMNNLEKRLGKNSDLFKELQEVDPSNLNILQSISSMTNAELKEYEKLYNQKSALAQKRATKENADLKKTTDAEIKTLKANAQKQIDELTKSYKNDIAKLAKETELSSKDVGSALISGINQGIKNTQPKLSTELEKMANEMVRKTKSLLKIKSPSGVFRDEVGKWLPLGIAEGFKESMPETEDVMRKSINDAIDGLKEDISSTNLQLTDAFNDKLSVGANKGEFGKQQTINFYQTNNSPKAMDRLTVYRETNSLLFSAKVRLSDV